MKTMKNKSKNDSEIAKRLPVIISLMTSHVDPDLQVVFLEIDREDYEKVRNNITDAMRMDKDFEFLDERNNTKVALPANCIEFMIAIMPNEY